MSITYFLLKKNSFKSRTLVKISKLKIHWSAKIHHITQFAKLFTLHRLFETPVKFSSPIKLLFHSLHLKKIKKILKPEYSVETFFSKENCERRFGEEELSLLFLFFSPVFPVFQERERDTAYLV